MPNFLLEVSIGHYLFVSGALFIMGLLGALLRKNIFVILMSIELMLNGVSLAFVTFGYYLNSVDGAVISLFITCISVIESLVGLMFVLMVFKKYKDTDVSLFQRLRG